MKNYIDGFVFPIAESDLKEYQQVAEAVASIYREYGAIEYFEFVGDDMQRECTQSFLDLVSTKPGEIVVFGWIVFESLESRNEINQKIMEDSRVADLVAPIVDPARLVFDSSRMAYGGFLPLVSSAGGSVQ